MTPCSLSLGQQTQHNVVIILMLLRHPNACNIVKHQRLSGVINGRLENLKAVIAHGRADSWERRRLWRARLTLLSGGLSVQENDPDDPDTLGFQRIIPGGIDDSLFTFSRPTDTTQ